MRQSLRNRLCDVFCLYYNPSKNSNLECRGALIIEELIKSGVKITFRKPENAVNHVTIKKIADSICEFCNFYDSDCDFVIGKENAFPCGGLIALSLMLEKGKISIDDIKKII